MESFTTFIGLAAATITTLCWLPQALHMIKTKDTSSVYLPSYLAFALGIACWLIYGLLIQDLPLILANMITLAIALIIIFLKLRYK